VEESVVEAPEPFFLDELEAGDVDVDAVASAATRKFYVDEGEALVTAEGFYLPDSESGRLRLVEYRDYVASEVRGLFGTPADLGARWRSHVGRKEVIEALERRGISLEEAAERTGLNDADPLDLLVNVAWNAPVMSRWDRVRRLRREHREWLEGFVPEARAVLEDLLEQYAEHGVGQLDDLRVLEVPPLNRHGTPVEIADRFGSAGALRSALDSLENHLYAA
jgi:type I restriction enzyme R subunit